jgi:UDP-glucose 4-epimerase
MSWLITGGCGFIGRNLVAELVRQGIADIRVFDDHSVGQLHELDAAIRSYTGRTAAEAGVTVMHADVLDQDAIHEACRGRDAIVHLAANTGVVPSIENPRSDCMTNIIGTLNCLEAARRHGVGRFVFASSGAPLGEVEPPIHEEKAPHPTSPYGASKLAGEGYCSAFWRSYGLATVALRFGNVYGPHSSHKSSVVATFIRQALAGEPLIINGDGQQTRDFIFVDDLVEAVWRSALLAESKGHVFQIATARETTVLELAQTLAQVLRDQGLAEVKMRHGSERTGDVRRNFSDTSKARRLLGWAAKTSLQEGLARTVAWFLTRKSQPEPLAAAG